MQLGIMRKGLVTLVTVTSAALLATALGAAPASAATPFDPMTVVQQHRVLGGSSAVAQQRDLSVQARTQGATIESAKTLTLTPTNRGLGAARKASATATVQQAKNFGIVAGVSSEGNQASFIAIKDATAPKSYSFTVDEPGAKLQLQANGAVTIENAAGEFVNYVATPWATDAKGKALPTHFTVTGTTITQHVDTSGATFPVVADPQQGCGIGYCSIYFNKSETKDIGSAGLTALGGAAAACAFAGPVAIFACAAAAASIGSTAQYATNHKKCVGIFYTTTPPPLTEWNPFTYTGKQCR